MSKRKTPVNPFYVLLVLLGLVFFVTACAYGVMAFRAVSEASHKGAVAGDGQPVPQQEASQLLGFLDRHGMQLLAGELVLLAIASFAAMGTDSYWTRRVEGNFRTDDPSQEHSASTDSSSPAN